ncbi:hypothetical protein [Mitsuokella jalaludinii]|uniref:hypothetical protein n=1 Tax=Mitsuokella jalaludinii TaxID=187979 RepID=UPI003078DA26
MTDEVKEQMRIAEREEDMLTRDILDAIRKHNVPYYRLKEIMEEIVGDIGDFVQINKDSVTEEIYPYIPTENQE